MSKILKSATHEANLVNKISTLSLDGPSKYSDVTVTVGIKSFYCHKLILALASNYFERKLFGTESNQSIHQIRIDVVLPDNFRNVLRYVYTGEVWLSDSNVENMFKAAVVLELAELKQMCINYMLDTLNISNCTRVWSLADADSMTESMLKEALESDDLSVDQEVEVCEMLLKWIDHQTQAGRSVQLYPLLTTIRWSAVSVDYIKSKLLGNSTVQRNQKSFEFLSKVISCQLSGVQSEGIRTFHRRSTGLEKCVVIVGVSDGNTTSSDMYRISLQCSESVQKLPDIPTSRPIMNAEAAACIMNEQVYVTGVGSSYNETWMWSPVTGWSRCGDMVSGRRRQCLGVVANSDMYILGGYVDSSNTALTSIEQYNRLINKWKEVGNLVHCTMNAGCAVHRTSIYVFGGINIDATDNDYVQVFDTSTKSCTLLTQRLPTAECLLRAVLWDKSVILTNNRTCFIFDLVQQSFEQRTQFAGGNAHCGMVLDNQTIYIVGGGINSTDKPDKDDKLILTCTDEVKRVPVMDIINNKPTANWVHHAKLPQPGLVHAFALTTLPVEHS